MPRRPLFTQQGLKWIERLKQLVMDKHTWLSILYMFIQFILGTIYFIVFTLMLSFSLSSIAIPFLQEFIHEPLVSLGDTRYFVPTWSYPLLVLGGFMLWTIFMHIARGVGQLHGRFAKWILVTE